MSSNTGPFEKECAGRRTTAAPDDSLVRQRAGGLQQPKFEFLRTTWVGNIPRGVRCLLASSFIGRISRGQP